MVLFLCMVTAIAWSMADLFRKKLADQIPTTQLSLWLVVGQLPFFALWAWYGIYNGQDLDIPVVYWQYGIACSFVNALSILGMLLSLNLAPISLTIPLLSLTPLISAVFDMLFSNEHLTSMQWGGLSVITVGAILLGLGKQGWFRVLGAWVMVGVAVLFSLLCSLERVATGLIGSELHALMELVGTGVFLVLYLVVQRRWKDFEVPWGHGKNILGVVISMTFGIGVQLYSYEAGIAVSIVEIFKRSVGIFASIYFGHAFFNESISPAKLYSACIMTLGIAVLMLGG